MSSKLPFAPTNFPVHKKATNGTTPTSSHQDISPSLPPTIIRIKRKREENPLDSLILETERPSKRATLRSITEALASLTTQDNNLVKFVGTKETDTRTQKKVYRLVKSVPFGSGTLASHPDPNERVPRQTLIEQARQQQQERGRAARYRVIERQRNLLEIERAPVVEENLVAEKENRNLTIIDDDYVYDIYEEATAIDPKVLHSVPIIRIDDFDEALTFENEYSDSEAEDSEDSNAADNPNNSYPDELSSEEDRDEYYNDPWGSSVDEEEEYRSEYLQYPEDEQYGQYAYDAADFSD